MKWRLIIDKEPRSSKENMAIDLALQRLCHVPVLRLYSWKPCAVSIGRFQSLVDEVDLDYCKKEGIDYVRRITGGGAVFHDKEITYSICINERNNYISSDLSKSYEQICACIIEALLLLGLKANYVPINDILVNGKKISGCAQTRKNNIILQHGTLLIEVDVDKMFRVLKVPNEKIRDKLIKDVRQRVTSLKDELGRKISSNELVEKIVNGFQNKLNVSFEISSLTKEEEELKEEIEKEVFSKDEWNSER